MRILLTGATAGIGRHLALDLARRGHTVWATGRNREALASLAAEAEGLDLRIAILDVADPSSVAAAAEQVGEIDVLVNNAGYGQPGALLELSDEELRAQFEVNVFGLMAVTRAFAPGMAARGRGTIVNVSSTGGRFTVPFFGAYHASKYALEALSDALRMELAPRGVKVVLIEPGPVRSSFAERSVALLPAGAADSPYKAAYARAEILRRQTDRLAVGPELVARAVRHAIGAARPRPRYLVPRARFALLLCVLAALPTRITDAIWSRLLGLGRAAEPA